MWGVALLSFALTLVGYAFVEGALVDVVGDLHEDGDSRSSFVQIFERTGARLRPLVAVSLLTGFGVALEPGNRWQSIWDAPSAVAASDHR
jgi:hypothetical protein